MSVVAFAAWAWVIQGKNTMRNKIAKNGKLRLFLMVSLLSICCSSEFSLRMKVYISSRVRQWIPAGV
jgi:hypothetical protein